MTDLATKTNEELKALEGAAEVAEFVLGGIWQEENGNLEAAISLLAAVGFTVEDEQDAVEFGQSIKDEIARREREEFYANGPRKWTRDEIHSALVSAANRAHHVNAIPASARQIDYLASLLAEKDPTDPFSGNTNDVLSAKRASLMISNFA